MSAPATKARGARPVPDTQSRRSEATKFLIAGGVAFAVDVGVFNLCLLLGMDGVAAKIVASVPATIVAYVGNRYWTYRDRDRTGVGREYPLFFLFSAIAAGIQAACVFVSAHLLGYDGVLADNISGNVVGMALATLFRFWAFRTWVFRPHPGQPHTGQVTVTTATGEPAS